MATYEKETLDVPLIQQYRQSEQLSVRNVFKLRPEELKLFFKKEHLRVPDNQGEKRESLIILEKVGMYHGLLRCLDTEAEFGIIGDRKDIKRRQAFFGINNKRLPPIKKFSQILRDQFKDTTIRILLVAAFFTLLVGIFTYYDGSDVYQWIEGASIFFAIALITSFAAGTDYMKEKQFLKLHDEIKNEEISVIRGKDGISQSCKVFNVVVGDVIVIEGGMRLPADCILIKGMDVKVDEAPYFEDRETIVQKTLSVGDQHENNHTDNPDPFLLNHSLVISGTGLAVVCAVGRNCMISEMKQQENSLDEEDEQFTPLQKKLENIADQIGKWGYLVGLSVFISSCIFYSFKLMVSDAVLLETQTLQEVLSFFTTAIAVIIVAVPEGLPLSISIAMAFSVDTLKNEQLLVKKLEACENMGSITEICTGKTATLTQNKMKVEGFYIADRYIVNEQNNTFVNSGLSQNLIQRVVDCIVLNNGSRVEMSDEARYVPTGNGTEVGCMNFVNENDIPLIDFFLRKEKAYEELTNIPFSSFRKRQLVAFRDMEKNSEMVQIVVKGAPEYVLPMCNMQVDARGNVKQLSRQSMEHILNNTLINSCCKNQLRCIVYAYKEISEDQYNHFKQQCNYFETEEDRMILERDLTFVVAFALSDSLRPGVTEVIQKLYNGGVNVRMISGDNIVTAIETAKTAGILSGDEEKIEYVCMEGEQFRNAVGGVRKISDGVNPDRWEVVDKSEFRKIAQRLKVLARSTPDDKFTLIVGLKDLGANVAVTADGLNDAAALKVANVGFCMGISGCQVAKEASDIILLDDNFKSVFRATQWGRNIYDNVRKFIQFQMTVNISAMIIIFLGSSTLGDSPFSVIQMLWMNMVMDTLAAIALATEPPHPTELNKQRIKKHDRVILNSMWRTILGQSLYQTLVMIVMLYAGPTIFNIQYDMINCPQYVTSDDSTVNGSATNKLIHQTFLFNTFMMMTLFNTFNCRKLGLKEFNIFSRIHNNLLFLVILAGEFVAQWFVIVLGDTLVGNIFSTTSLPFTMFATSIAFGAGTLLVGAALKATPEHWVDKLHFQMNEEGTPDQDDFCSRLYNRIFGKGKKGDNEESLLYEDTKK